MITINDLCGVGEIDETVIYDEVIDIITDIVSRNLNIRRDEINLDAEIVKDLGATPICFTNIFVEIAKTFELTDRDDFISTIKTINDLIICVKENCDLLLVKAKRLISQYLKIPFSEVDLDELEEYGYNYTTEQKDIVRLLINNIGYENLCLLDCFCNLTLEDIKTIQFEKIPYEQKKKDLISSLIKSIGIENLCLLDDLSDLTLEDIKEIIHTNKETN